MGKDLVGFKPISHFWVNLKKNRNKGHNFHTNRGETKLNDNQFQNFKKVRSRTIDSTLIQIEQKQIRNLNKDIDSL